MCVSRRGVHGYQEKSTRVYDPTVQNYDCNSTKLRLQQYKTKTTRQDYKTRLQQYKTIQDKITRQVYEIRVTPQ